MKVKIYFYVVISICFIFGVIDWFLSLFLLSTGYFIEVNVLAFPYFIIIPLLLLFPKDDKVIVSCLGVLALFLGIVVSINLTNLVIYIQVIL